MEPEGTDERSFRIAIAADAPCPKKSAGPHDETGA
jgi:hypothetical protein